MLLIPSTPLWQFAGSSASVILPDGPDVDPDAASEYTFAIDGSAAAANRRIFIPIHWQGAATHREIATVTINGVSATVRQRGHSGGGGPGATSLGAAIASAVVPTGSGSMNVVVTMEGPGSVTRMAIAPIVTYGLADASAHDADTDENAGTASSIDVTIDVPSDGLLIAVYTGSTGAVAAVSWTGAAELYDQKFLGDTFGRISLAVSHGLDAQTGRLVRASKSSESEAGNDLVVETWT